MKVLKQVLLSLGCVIMLSCNNDDDKPDKKPDSVLDPAAIKEVKATYAKIAFANYEDALTKAKDLKTAIDTFVGTPTEENFNKAKNAWYDARAPYSLTEAYRFSDGPIDNVGDGEPEVYINSWPLDESYIDYVVYDDGYEKDAKRKSFINDTSFDISKESLKKKNMPEGPDDAKVSIGYHAIEFLLWGQDTETPVDIANGGDEHNPAQNTGGKRSYLDYVVGTKNYQLNGDGTTFIIKKGSTTDSIEVKNKDRRGKYLKVCAELLVDDLQSVLDQWDSSKSDNYYAEFMKMSDKKALQTMMTGIGTLANSELAEERIKAAISLAESGDGIQEDEHDCFSDDSYMTIRSNLQSSINLYEGTYTRVDGSTVVKGKSIKDLGAKLTGDNAAVYKSVNAAFDKAKTDMEATHIPFDYGVSNESTRGKFSEVYKDLTDLGEHFGKLASAFGINISISG